MNEQHKSSTICIIMGVSGSGKSTIGQLLSDKLGWRFYDGDDFHPLENIEKMRRGLPLNDADREPWLKILRDLIDNLHKQQENGIIACSALKENYRNILENNDNDIIFIYLKGSFQQLQERLGQREEHFMKAEMLISQLETLEEPENVIVIDISLSPQEIVEKIISHLNLSSQM